jgi:Flp pilus assembly pilin Flp
MNKKGQSTIEYAIVFVAVISVVVLAAPAFLKPAVCQYYNSAGGYIESTANGIDAMAQSIPDQFSKTWANYTFNEAYNMPVTMPTFAEATSGMANMAATSASYSSSGSSGEGCTGWPC